MRANTHLPPEDYFDDTDVGEVLTEEMNELATEAVGKDAVVVPFCDERSQKYGYEVRVGDTHEQIDSGYATLLEALAAFQEWAERVIDEDDGDPRGLDRDD